VYDVFVLLNGSVYNLTIDVFESCYC